MLIHNEHARIFSQSDGLGPDDKLASLMAELGVTPIINASAPKSNLSGPALSHDIASIVGEAQKWCFDLADLNRRAGAYCAAQLGAGSGALTGGTSAGILLALEVAKKMNKIDSTPEVIIRRGDFGHYAYLFQQAGCVLHEVGNIVGCSSEELTDAFNERTVALAVVISPRLPPADLSLAELVKLADDHNIPVIADCAAIFPSRERLSEIVGTGCHAVLLSGGKVFGGPQASGLLLGDQSFVEFAHLMSFPSDGPLRAVKLDRGQMLGLAAAIVKFLAKPSSTFQAEYRQRCEAGVSELGQLRGAAVSILPEILIEKIPMIAVEDTSGLGHEFFKTLTNRLLNGPAPIGVHYIRAKRIICLSPIGLTDQQLASVCRLFRKAWMELADDVAERN